VAQTINCIHSLFLAQDDKYTRTPPYYVFELYRPHMGARRLEMAIRAEELTVPAREGTATMPSLSASASRRDKIVTVTLTNPSHDAALATRVRFTGPVSVSEVRGTVLTHDDMRGRNTFERPDEVRLSALAVKLDGATVLVDLPKHSVAAVEVRLSA
jgi:alpha-N-arabinofuranosidase